jgi:hypothetical protein
VIPNYLEIHVELLIRVDCYYRRCWRDAALQWHPPAAGMCASPRIRLPSSLAHYKYRLFSRLLAVTAKRVAAQNAILRLLVPGAFQERMYEHMMH